MTSTELRAEGVRDTNGVYHSFMTHYSEPIYFVLPLFDSTVGRWK